jgi:glucose/arabinose dehydrogenase
MSPLFKRAATAALLLASGLAEAQDVVTLTGTATPSVTATACAAVLTPSYAAPVAARGWKAQLVATGLKTPRGIKFDTNGGLLVIESGARLTHLTLNDNGGTCVSVERNTTLLEDEDVSGPRLPSQLALARKHTLTPASSTTAWSCPRTAGPSTSRPPRTSTDTATTRTPSPSATSPASLPT